VRQVVVVAEAGWAAHATLRLMTAKHSPEVCAMPRTRKCPKGTPRRDLVHHLPQSCSSRRASHTPDGRRQDSWVFPRRATLHHLGDVTIVRSKKRRNQGPKGVKILVTNRPAASAGAMRSIDARRWGIEVTRKALQSGLPLGQRQVTKASARVGRSGVLSVLASLLLVRLYGRDEAHTHAWSLLKRKERFLGEVAQDAVWRTERKWQRQLRQCKDGA